MKRPPKSRVIDDMKSRGVVTETPRRGRPPKVIGNTPAISTGTDVTEPEMPIPPADWAKGALLNVRSTGGDYIVTLYPEEYDPRSPERALRFSNPARVQDFISKWYSRQSAHPLAR